MKKITILLAAVLTLSLMSCSHDSPEKAVDNFYKAAQEQDFATALSYSNFPENEREQVIPYLEELGMEIYGYEILGSDIDEGDTTATVFLKLVTAGFSNDSTESEINVPCVLCDEGWKVKFI